MLPSSSVPVEIGMKQMGQSPKCVPSGCLNKISLRNSAARFLTLVYAAIYAYVGIQRRNI